MCMRLAVTTQDGYAIAIRLGMQVEEASSYRKVGAYNPTSPRGNGTQAILSFHSSNLLLVGRLTACSDFDLRFHF